MIKESNKTNPNSFDGLILEISNEIHLTKLPSKRRKYIGPIYGRIPTVSYLAVMQMPISPKLDYQMSWGLCHWIP